MEQLIKYPVQFQQKKIAGERAYDLVREGEEVELPAKEVVIEKLKILAIHRNEHLDVDIDVSCSAGTYIRAIARDLGRALGVGGHLIELRRTEVSPFTLSDAGDIENAPVMSLATEISKFMKTRKLTFEEIAEIRFGRRIDKSETQGPIAGIAPNGEVAAILENRDGRAQPITVFNS